MIETIDIQQGAPILGMTQETKKMKKVLMISYVFPPINRSGSQRPFYFAKHLPEFGYRPIVITAERGEMSDVDTKPLLELSDCCKIVSIRKLSPHDWVLKVRRWLRALDKVSHLGSKDKRWLSDIAERTHEQVRGRLRANPHRQKTLRDMCWISPASFQYVNQYSL